MNTGNTMNRLNAHMDIYRILLEHLPVDATDYFSTHILPLLEVINAENESSISTDYTEQPYEFW